MIYALFLASGATGLVYQVAWMRDLSLVFGASFEAQSIVLATFMAGLAAGGFSFGRRAHRLARPLRVYGLLAIGVAVFALALPLLLEWVDAAYLSVALRASGSDAWLNAARVAMAFALLLLPTFCMGGTLPVLVRLRVQRYGEFGERLSVLYAINTFGAVIGTLLAGFVLLPELGVWRSELLAALANLLIGAVAIGLDRALAIRTTPPAEAHAGGLFTGSAPSTCSATSTSSCSASIAAGARRSCSSVCSTPSTPLPSPTTNSRRSESDRQRTAYPLAEREGFEPPDACASFCACSWVW